MERPRFETRPEEEEEDDDLSPVDELPSPPDVSEFEELYAMRFQATDFSEIRLSDPAPAVRTPPKVPARDVD